MHFHARAAGLTALFALAVVLTWEVAPQNTRNILEDTAYRFDPTAARAFAYGERHFNAKNRSGYDIERAEYFFNKAADIDPTTPYLYHELARIAFLKGDFETAMVLIDSQIELMGDAAPNSYYVRGLIRGYRGEYANAAKDYEHFLQFHPANWAAINDYAWVLLKADRAQEAVDATLRGLGAFPYNAWLLSTNAAALYEVGHTKDALSQARAAVAAAGRVSENDWLTAYPGNDPQIAKEGVAALRAAARSNMHTIELALASSTVQ